MTKKLVFIVLTFVLVFLTGCKDNSLPVDKIIAETEEHRVFYSGDKCYMEFFEEYKQQDGGLLQSSSWSICVQSTEKLRKKIIENDFTWEDKFHIQLATTDEEGSLNRCIFDIENMYEPVFSDETELVHIIWQGYPQYTCVARYADSFYVFIDCYEKDYFAEIYEREVTDVLADLAESDSYTVTQLDYRDAVEYRNDNEKHIVYNIESGGRVITVKEQYYLVEREGYIASETVPYSIYVYVTDGDVNYSAGMSELNKYFTEHPGEEWLLSFGVEPLVTED